MTAPTWAVPTGEMTLRGRIMPASNATFLAEVDGTEVVYKPVAGERPLWDFPDGTLAAREVAAYVVSEALGWGVVPPTVIADGPYGPGMVQLWCPPDESDGRLAPVDLVGVDEVPDGVRHVLDALDADDEPVALIHEDSSALRAMAVFDVLVNNADRKGGHVLAFADGRRLGVDHGVSFHVEDKLRTVLWGWAGEALSETELDAVRGLAADEALAVRLGELLTNAEVDAFTDRCTRLVRAAVMPLPATDRPAIPWPAF